ncbi:hypothetical protein ACWT_6102 [Actinoplanes sp. SE50]|uniref:CPBP family glutamic-type intramembrane protease n=1 Tax=unclassified Actinoplanes TaxID=2626549 RepID=UPI00023ECBA7|nr:MULTISPECIES: CPBP family glutamic-type intramembrane protease [unclassified Actinoplanes]AEV87119.1 hypothetical protein ACPL_6234 [Actinoplanes sp. SE50/110]ATO85517.1 hypothetical protein ACWT_6102 [Actinoplanes sp. SE50]SLM02929.1 uncharacterized protein ACSP50_6214 [Actinoplanes sp. SE50/110]
MTVTNVRAGRVRRPYATSFDRPGWTLDSRRLIAMSCVAAFSVGLWSVGGDWARVMAIVVIVEALLMCLPWRVPRTMRSGVSFWAETLCGLLAPIVAVTMTVVTRPAWLTAGADWWWFGAAVAVAAGLIALSDLRLPSLLSGELAFVFGPTPRAHGAARAFATTVCAVGEEAVFRVPALLVSPAAPVGLLGAIAFVARHHIQPGTNRRGTIRSTMVEIAAGVLLLGLTVASGSIYPALLAHILNNIPNVILELQRENDDRGWT